MKKNFFTFLFSFVTIVAYAQTTMTLSGVVKDGENGETLIGATVYIPEFNTGTVTNEYGFYSITLDAVDKDSISVEMSYVGFQNQMNRVKVLPEVRLDVELGTGVALQEVVIKANSYNEVLKSTEMSVETLNPKEAKLIPVLLGESDILKTIQLKPGIPSGSEGSTGLYVRGGRSDQNLIVLDEAVIYNASHLFGFFSTFNTDAVKDLKLYKGGFPSQYGGRLSSVIDVKLKEGNKKKFEGAGGIGLISSKLTLEGPIKKDKSSFIVSGRRTYFDLITNAINESNADDPDATQIPGYYFYDLNTKINFDLSDKDRLYLSGYFGRDVFNFSSDFFNFNFGWGNATGTARWNHQFNPKLFSNTTVTFSDYQYEITNEVTGFSFEVGSRIKDLNLKSDFYWALNNRHTLRYGIGATYHQFEVGRLQAGSDDGSISFNSGSDFDGMEFGAYIGDEWDVSDRFRVNGGDYNVDQNSALSDSDLYTTRISRARHNYLPNWMYTPYLYGKNQVWNKSYFDSDVFYSTNKYINLRDTRLVCEKSYWLWQDLFIQPNLTSQFTPSISGDNIHQKSTWRPFTGVQAYYHSNTLLVDLLTKREYIYRTYFEKNRRVISIPRSFTTYPQHPLIKELKASFQFIDPITYGSAYSRETYYNSLSYFKFLLLKNWLLNLNNLQTTSQLAGKYLPINVKFVNEYFFYYFFGSQSQNKIGQNNELYKNQFRPLKKGITNMLRLHGTGAVAMPIEMRLRILASSRDIIHSWSVPSAGIKIDCIPGYTSHRIMTFMTPGIYWGQCQEICGRYHHWMPIICYFMKRDLFFLWCTHFIFKESSREFNNASPRQFNDYIRFASYDKSSWLSEMSSQ